MITTTKRLKAKAFPNKGVFWYSFGPKTAEAYRKVYADHYNQIGKEEGFIKMFLHYHYGFGDSGIQIAKYTYHNEKESFISVELEPTFEDFNPLKPNCKDLNPENVKVNYVLYSVFEGYRETLATIPVGEEDKLLFWLEGSFVATKRKFERYEKMEAERDPKRKRNHSNRSIRFKNSKHLSLANV